MVQVSEPGKEKPRKQTFGSRNTNDGALGTAYTTYNSQNYLFNAQSFVADVSPICPVRRKSIRVNYG